MFTLKQFDISLLTFEIYDEPLEGQKCRIISINDEYKKLFPIGLDVSDTGLMKWLRTRIIPKNREFVNAFLAKNGLSQTDTKGILQVCRGLSLNDSYWITEDGFDGKFDDYNLYDNEFVKVLSLIAYTGYGSSRVSGFSSSPEFTTNGMLRKGWRRIDGKILLYKGGTSGAANTGNEPYSEYYASQIAQTMGINHIEYGLSKWKGGICSTCELFCTKDISFVPIYRFIEDPTLKNVAEFLKNLGDDFYNAYADMLIFDALICNEDRHFANFGLMVDNKTNHPVSFAPVFDNGLSLFNFAMPDDIDNLKDYAKTRSSAYGIPFENIVKEFISPRQKEMLRKMLGFKFTRHKNYNLPSHRIKMIEQYINKRASDMLNY